MVLFTYKEIKRFEVSPDKADENSILDVTINMPEKPFEFVDRFGRAFTESLRRKGIDATYSHPKIYIKNANAGLLAEVLKSFAPEKAKEIDETLKASVQAKQPNVKEITEQMKEVSKKIEETPPTTTKTLSDLLKAGLTYKGVTQIIKTQPEDPEVRRMKRLAEQTMKTEQKYTEDVIKKKIKAGRL